MHLKASDIVAVCSGIVAFGAAASQPAIEAVFPGHGTYISGVVALASLAAGVVIRTLSNPTGAPAKAIVEDAPVVPASTAIVEPSTHVVGTNVSTTSTEPLLAPQKGTS